ncbi:MAG: hypothetical protein MI867_04355 [Pseudomonadales bacterium]|nr:hypothetical protein [Pseudomonadales bacterium]
MTKLIKVEPSFNTSASDTFSDAIKKVTCINIDNYDVDRYKQLKLIDYAYGQGHLALIFNNEDAIVIGARQDSIHGEIYTKQEIPESLTSINESITFDFGKGNVFIWEWKKMLDSLIGLKIKFIPGNQYLFFSASDGRSFIVNSAQELGDKNKHYLYIVEI